MSEPTPTPWRTIHQYIFSGDHAIPISSGHKEYATNPNGELYAQAQANAAFIVKAVNSHDALVKALQAAQGQIMNAKIDLQTGHTKAAGIRTLDGIIKFVDDALAQVHP